MHPIRVGTCGWSYQEWVGAFYPNNRVAKLPFYTRIFNSVEVDSSFYRAPSKAIVAGWSRAAGPDFKFSLKIPKIITHDRHLQNAEKELLGFVELVEPLARAGKLGCLLVQLPPNFSFKEKDALESFFSYLPLHIHFAVEFRHKSWFEPDVYGILHAHGAAFVIGDDPRRVEWPQVVTTEWSFVRFHYGSRGRNGNYSERELEQWAARLEEWHERGDVFAYFNNDWLGYAVKNGLWLRKRLGQHAATLEGWSLPASS